MDSASTSIKTLDAVIELAIAMENHGRNYYANVLDKATDPRCRKFFSWLVEQEEAYHQTFLHLLEDSSEVEISPEELTGGYGYLIQRLVKEVTEALNESEKLSKNVAIEQAIFFEKSVIRYFQK